MQLAENHVQKQGLKRLFSKRMPDRLRELVKLLSLSIRQPIAKAIWLDNISSLSKSIRSSQSLGFHDTERALLKLIALIETQLLPLGDDPNSELPSEALKSKIMALIELLMALIAHHESHSTLPTSKHVETSDEEPLTKTQSANRLLLQINDSALQEKLAAPLKEFGFELEYTFNQQNHYLANICDLSNAPNSKKKTPLLIVSEQRNIATRLAAVRVGAKAFLPTPIASYDLLKAIDELNQNDQHTPYRVLVVDDSPTSSTYISQHLLKANMEVHALNNPLEVLEKLAAFKPELILLDMQMPDCSGIELAQVIRQHSGYSHIPLIFLSAEDDYQAHHSALMAKGDDFITKPIDADALVNAVTARILRNRQMLAQINRDPQTGTYTRGHFWEEAELEVSRAKRNNAPLSLVLINILSYTQLGQEHGADKLELALMSLAKQLDNRLRVTDIIGRVKEDQFAALLPGCDLKLAEQLIRDFMQSYENTPITQHIKLPLCAGISAQHDNNLFQLRFTAEQALKQCNEESVDKVICYQAN